MLQVQFNKPHTLSGGFQVLLLYGRLLLSLTYVLLTYIRGVLWLMCPGNNIGERSPENNF
jgi:hypothetical protein